MNWSSFARESHRRRVSGGGVGAIGDGPVPHRGGVVDGVSQDAPEGLTESFRQVKSSWIIHVSSQVCFDISSSRKGRENSSNVPKRPSGSQAAIWHGAMAALNLISWQTQRGMLPPQPL